MKKHFLLWDNPRQAIFMIMFILLGIGCINVFSASFIFAQDTFGNALYYLWRYLFFAAAGCIAIILIRRIGYKRLLTGKLMWLFYFVVLIMLIVVDAVGIANKGAARWLYVGPVSIQPSECAKLVIIMLCARYLGNLLRAERRISLLHGSGLKMVMATALYTLLVLKQPDLGTAAIIAGLMIGMFIIAGLPAIFAWGIVGLGLLGGAAATVLSPYRWERIKVWLDPWLDAEGSGYQMVQSLLAIGSGGLTGTNWGMGAGKFSYLPEAHTDFAFAIFCQENGLAGALLLLLLFALLACAFCQITFNTRDKKGFLLAGGITFLIIGQAVANMAMVCGILPVIGVPLIFISYGGSSMLVSMAAIGLLLSVYDEEQKRAELDALPPETRRDNLRVIERGMRRQQS